MIKDSESSPQRVAEALASSPGAAAESTTSFGRPLTGRLRCYCPTGGRALGSAATPADPATGEKKLAAPASAAGFSAVSRAPIDDPFSAHTS